MRKTEKKWFCLFQYCARDGAKKKKTVHWVQKSIWQNVIRHCVIELSKMIIIVFAWFNKHADCHVFWFCVPRIPFSWNYIDTVSLWRTQGFFKIYTTIGKCFYWLILFCFRQEHTRLRDRSTYIQMWVRTHVLFFNFLIIVVRLTIGRANVRHFYLNYLLNLFSII